MRRTVVVAMSSPRIRAWRRRPQSVRIFRGDDLRSSDADDHLSRLLATTGRRGAAASMDAAATMSPADPLILKTGPKGQLAAARRAGDTRLG